MSIGLVCVSILFAGTTDRVPARVPARAPARAPGRAPGFSLGNPRSLGHTRDRTTCRIYIQNTGLHLDRLVRHRSRPSSHES